MKKLVISAALTILSQTSFASVEQGPSLIMIQNQEKIIKNQEETIKLLSIIANSSSNSNSSKMKPFCKCIVSMKDGTEKLVRVQEVGGKLVENELTSKTTQCNNQMKEHPACNNYSLVQ